MIVIPGMTTTHENATYSPLTKGGAGLSLRGMSLLLPGRAFANQDTPQSLWRRFTPFLSFLKGIFKGVIFFLVALSWPPFPRIFSSALAESLRAPGKVFPLGETLVYEVRWDPPAWVFFMPTISAGELTFRFQEKVSYKGAPAYRITAEAISSGFLPKVTGISVQDFFESIVDAREFCSFKMIKKTREGKRKRDIFLTFDSTSGKGHFLAYDASKQPPVELKNEEVKNIPACVQDLLSAIYQTRLRDLRIGEKYPLTISDNGIIKEIELRVRKGENVEAAAGTFSTLKVETVSVFGGLFKSGGSLLVWFSDDEYKIPVKFEAKVKIGKLFGTLKKMQGANTLAMR